jgi:hypothetical protein
MIVAGDPMNLGMEETFGRAFVTDGRRLVRVPVTLEEGDVPGLITPESLVMCRKLTDKRERSDGTRMVMTRRSVVADNTATFPRKQDMRLIHNDEDAPEGVDEYADLDEVFGKSFPSAAAMDLLIPDAEGAMAQITLNPTMLREMADALGSKDQVTLKFFTHTEAVRVEGAGEIADAVGVLMPIRANGKCAGFEMLGLPDEVELPKDYPDGPALPGTEDEDMILQAIEVIRELGRASTSSLQRRLRIGYNRAANIMDILEERGVIGPPAEGGARDVLALPDAKVGA